MLHMLIMKSGPCASVERRGLGRVGNKLFARHHVIYGEGYGRKHP